MKIEVGKTYTDGKGYKVKIERSKNCAEYPFIGKVEINDTYECFRSYQQNGQWCKIPTENDLVCEFKFKKNTKPAATPMKIDLSKIYRTRDGRKVQLLAISQDPKYPVLGCINFDEDDDWRNDEWTIEGNINTDGIRSSFDLIEVVPVQFPVKVKNSNKRIIAFIYDDLSVALTLESVSEKEFQLINEAMVATKKQLSMY